MYFVRKEEEVEVSHIDPFGKRVLEFHPPVGNDELHSFYPFLFKGSNDPKVECWRNVEGVVLFLFSFFLTLLPNDA